AERSPTRIVPERNRDTAGEARHEVSQRIERADLHGRADLAARNRGARWRPEYELRRGTGGDSEGAAGQIGRASCRGSVSVSAICVVEGEDTEGRYPAARRDRLGPATNDSNRLT